MMDRSEEIQSLKRRVAELERLVAMLLKATGDSDGKVTLGVLAASLRAVLDEMDRRRDADNGEKWCRHGNLTGEAIEQSARNKEREACAFDMECMARDAEGSALQCDDDLNDDTAAVLRAQAKAFRRGAAVIRARKPWELPELESNQRSSG